MLAPVPLAPHGRAIAERPVLAPSGASNACIDRSSSSRAAGRGSKHPPEVEAAGNEGCEPITPQL